MGEMESKKRVTETRERRKGTNYTQNLGKNLLNPKGSKNGEKDGFVIKIQRTEL